MEELEDLPILKKTDKGIEAVYEDGNDLPILKKKDYPESSSSTGGKVGALETPSTGSSPFLQKAKERAEQGAPTVLSVKKETVKEVGLPSYTPTKEEELKAPTQKQFEQQALPPTYQKESALDISKKQTQVATERSKALDELIKTKKEAQSSYEKIRNLDKQIESFEPQFEKFKTTAEAFQPDIQEYKNLTSQIAEIKNKSNSFVLEYNNEYQKLAPKLEAYKQIFENEKLPNEKRQDAYENYNGIVSILKNKEKLLDQAVAQNEQGIGDLEARAKSFDETIKKATANQAGFSQLYSQYKSLIDERNKSAEGLGVYEKRMSDAQNQIKQKLFEQSQLEDVRQQKLEKEYSTWQNFFESLPKMGIEAVAGVADMLNVLGFSGDPESPETKDEVKKETRQNIEKLRKFGDSFITQELPKNYEKLFEGQFSLKKLANVGFNAIASTAPTIAAGLIGGPAAGVAAGAGMAFGESKEIMKEAGLTEEQAEAAAFGLSIPIGLLENYGAEDIVKLFSKEAVEYSTKIFLKNIAGRTLTKEQLFNEAKNTIGQIIKDGAPQLLKEGVKESGTEVSQGTVNEVAKQVAQEFTGVDLDENMSWSDYLKEQAEVRGEEAIGGFIGGTSMQTIGLGIKSAGEGIFPTFNPSAYQKALELLDPSKMEAFSQEVQQEVQDKVLTQEQADLAFRNIQLIQETNKLIPATIDNKDLRTEALNLLIEKKETQKEIEGKDDALVAPQKARIAEINKRLSDIANGKEEEVVTPTVKLNKNTTPTEEKYGTIDRGDGKGVVDLTRAEYEAELAKQGGEETEETTVFETDKTESRQPIDLSIEPTAPTEGVEAGQEQVKEAVSVFDKKADIERRRKEKLNAKDKQSGKLIRDFDSNADIIEKRRVIDEFIKNKGENLESIEGWNDLRGDIQELLFEGKFDEAKAKVPQTYEEKINSIYDAELARELYKEIKAGKLVADMTPVEQQVANKYITEELKKSVDAELKAGQEQVAPTTQEEKGALGIPSKTDKAYQEAQGVTERISKAHPEASVLVLPKGNDLSLTALYVGKEKRGKGIGSGVLESVKAEADKLGKKVVLDATNELDNDTDLERLGEFYERNGFVKVGENKFEYTPKKNQLLTPNINQNETVNENVREIGNGQKDGQKGDVSQEAKSNVQEGEEKVAEGEEPTAEQVDKASKAVGTTPSNLRDLYRVNRDLFGQNRVRAFASAIAMDRMIGAMAKRAGIPKQRMYEKLQFRKDTEANVLKADNALFQGMVDGKPVTLRNMDVDVVNGFYSPIEKNLMEYGKDKIKAKDWLNVVGKSDEAVFTGVRAFLEGKDPNAMVSKQEILDYMKDNRISVVEVVKGKDDYRNLPEYKEADAKSLIAAENIQKAQQKYWESNSDEDFDALQEAKNELEKWTAIKQSIERRKEKEGVTKFSQYQLEGEKENYKEVLVTLPKKVSKGTVEQNEDGTFSIRKTDGTLTSKKWSSFEEADRYNESATKSMATDFQSTHFDEPNILVHLRMNTRTDADGNKVLFLEEVQSDWGQTGKKEGFKVSNIEKLKQELVEAEKEYNKLDFINLKLSEIWATPEAQKVEKLKEQIKKAESAIPTAPFVMDTNAWTKLGLKVALKEAVAQGVDKIAWTTGEQQFDRWGSEKISWKKEGSKWKLDVKEQVSGTAFEGVNIDEQALSESNVTVDSKERLREILNRNLKRERTEAELNKLTDRIWDRMQKEDSGISLPRKEGMESFYGTEGTKGIVGGVAEKLFGQKVGETKIKTSETIESQKLGFAFVDGKFSAVDNNGKVVFSSNNRKEVLDYIKGKNLSTQPSIDVTPALRAEVIRGLALFQRQQGQQAKGAMVAADGTLIIYALSDPNVSTPLHEMAHVFEHYLTESERQTIIRNAGTGAWTTETSEYFARGFEKYLAEGVAPTKELQKVFEKFKEWLTEIYNGITGSEIDIQLNDEMRAIYAQMFGEEEVNSKFKPNEKITQKEDGKPLPEGISGVRTETEERKTSPELRPQEEEVRSIIDNAVANFYAINEATKRSEKREAAKEYRQNLEKMPTVKNIFDNIKTIFAQLEAEGVITKSKDCP